MTWASGYFDRVKKKFKKEFKEEYFLSDPDFFYKKHYTDNKEMVFADIRLSKKNFVQSPIYYEGYKKLGIQKLLPGNGTIKLKQKDSLEISLDTHRIITSVYFKFDHRKGYFKPTMSIENHNYIFRYRFDKPIKDAVTIYINGEGIITYNVIVK